MKKYVSIFILAVLFTGCSNQGKEGKTPADSIFKVKTAQVLWAVNDHSYNYSGTVEAAQVIPLSFRTVGNVDKIFVEVGDAVRKGQLLATLDQEEMQNIYNAALAKYRQAEDAYQRLKQVHDKGSLPEIKWVEMETNFEQARSSLEISKSNLEKCKLVSPVNGLVGRRNIEPGQSSVSLTSAPLELVRIETVLVKISVPENEINKVKTGLKAVFTVTALGGKSFEGVVTNISPVAEVMSRTYTVKISVDNPGRELKPGMVCDVSLGLATGGRVLIVPQKAVSRDSEGNTYVFLVTPDKNHVKKQIVKTGNYTDTGIEVTEGLTEGQTIVSEGGEKLSDNSSISL